MNPLDSPHVSELHLRRLRAGELPPQDARAMQLHLSSCGACRLSSERLEEEQRAFEARIPLERFVGGVERASRARASPRRRWIPPIASMAAMVLVLVLAPEISRGLHDRHNRRKGGTQVELRIAGPNAGPQRVAAIGAPEALARGERVRIGVQSNRPCFVTAVSIDAQGETTPLYPESGRSVALAAAPDVQYLPESLEFTGSGLERVVVLLSDQPLEVAEVQRAAREAFARAGRDVGVMSALGLPGDQFAQMLLKP